MSKNMDKLGSSATAFVVLVAVVHLARFSRECQLTLRPFVI